MGGESIPKKRSLTKRIFKWSGIGCGGMLALFILAIIIGITAEPPSPEFQTGREAFLAGAEAGDALRAEGRELDDDFFQEAVSRVEPEAFGSSDMWIIANNDVLALCDAVSRLGQLRIESLDEGADLTIEEYENFLQGEGLKRAFLIGAIPSDGEAVADFCIPIQAYGIGFIAAFEVVAKAYELTLDESEIQASLDSAIDAIPRTELGADSRTAYDNGFFYRCRCCQQVG